MADSSLFWADLSNIASTAQLTGVDFIKVIELVIKAAKNPRILKKRCRLFGQHLEHVGELLKIIMPAELMEDTRIREPLKRLENAIKAAWVPVNICEKGSKFYLYTSGCYIAKRLKDAQEEVDECLKIIPLLVLAAMQQQERRVNAREDEEWKKNIAAQMAAIQSFRYKQLLDEACKDITDKTDYEYFAKKWGHDQRFEVLDRKERESLFNERVISLRKTLKEKVKARQVAPIGSFSDWPEGNPSNVPLVVGEVVDDGVPEDFIGDPIMSVGDSVPVEQLDKGNPSNLPLLVGELLDNGIPDYFIEDVIMSAGDSLPVEQLIEEYEKRNRLPLLKNILEHLVREGSQDVHVHSALGKICIDTNDKPEHFLETNLYYDSYVVGKRCEKRSPTLAVAAYWRGQCDDELIDVTNKNFLFELQARYVVERADPQLWKRVFALENPHRRELIDRVTSTVLPESKNSDQVSATVKAFINADRPHELIELLEKIVLQNSTFSGNPNLQDLLIYTAIKADRSRLMDYINRLDNFDGPAIGEIAIGKKLYEEAFNIFKKFNLNVLAVNVLLDHIRSFERAYQFASRVKKDVVWKKVCFACVDAEEFRLARLCGLNIIVQEDGLEEVREYYQKKGRINELISLMEEGLRLDSWHTTLKELHILYAKYRPDKLKEHIELF